MSVDELFLRRPQDFFKMGNKKLEWKWTKFSSVTSTLKHILGGKNNIILEGNAKYFQHRVNCYCNHVNT